MKRTLALAATLSMAGLVSCDKKAEKPAAPPVTVTVAPVEVKTVYETNTWVGLTDGYQNAEIRAQVTGYLMTQDYKQGSFVKQGTTLFTIDKRPFEAALAQAQADYAKAVAQAQLAQITLDRQTQLYKTKVISQQEYDTSYTSAQANVASVAAAQANVQTAQINLNYCTIAAPFDGIVGVAQAQIGDLVGPGGTSAVLTQMSQVDPIKVNFFITEQQYLKAATLINEEENRPEQDKKSVVDLKLADGSVYSHKGYYAYINRQIDVATGSIQVTALFPNEGGVLRPGLFARVTAPVNEMKDAMLVPQAAIVELQGNQLISVVGPDNVIATHPVKLGPVEGQNQVVLAGIQPTDKVVVGGVEKVKPGMKVIPQPYVAPAPPPQPGKEAAPAPKATPVQ